MRDLWVFVQAAGVVPILIVFLFIVVMETVLMYWAIREIRWRLYKRRVREAVYRACDAQFGGADGADRPGRP